MSGSNASVLKAVVALLAVTLLCCALAGANASLIVIIGGGVALAVAGGWLAGVQMPASKLKGVALLCTAWILAPVIAYFGLGLPAAALSGDELNWQWTAGHVFDRLFICYLHLGPLAIGTAVIACLMACRARRAHPV